MIIPLPPLQTVSENSSCSKSSQHRYSCLYFQHFPCPCLDASFLPRSHFSVCAWALPAPEYSLRLGETLSFMGIFVLLRSSSSYTHPLDIKKKKISAHNSIDAIFSRKRKQISSFLKVAWRTWVCLPASLCCLMNMFSFSGLQFPHR